MEHRQLGAKGFEVSEIGLGCWQLGSDWGTGISEALSFKILNEATTHGIDFFDTADVYGNGLSEKRIGAFLKQQDKPIRVATKFGRNGNVFPNSYTKDKLRKSVEGSLERLGIDALDLLQLHCVPFDVLKQGDIFDWLRDLKNEGLIHHFGASVETIEEGFFCMQQEGLVSLQVIFNVFRQKLVTDLLPQAEANGIGIIVRLPLASGLLTGKYTKNTTFAEEDHRNYNRNGDAFNVGETFAGVPFEKGIDIVNSIEKNILPSDLSMVQLALRWILDHNAVSTIIPGASSPKQVVSNVEAAKLSRLSAQTHKALSALYENEIHKHVRGAY
ncbi:Predicted oxidoreductase [Hyunsoonleella jejuensis]|uniref:Predicted oxidoreductase n=1 Tax=Hyunsoonleella jejuensis TaxID=419940 RepID=A0A1H9K6Q4_9FLAO|nr:aldo/keto reductase [Hyunsoonleella jejuensis]SEQ94718.1 Predicted oxidoreductase [Hyunsoonleella jejuensis]